MNKFKSGKHKSYLSNTPAEYQAFLPESLFQDFQFQNKSTIILLEQAVKFLSEINIYSKLIPNVDYFIKMHVNKEAISSSKIEGTKTGIDELILPKEEIKPERRDDWQEVQNYVEAINFGIAELKNLPVSVRLIKLIHKKLLNSVRGENKLPGEIRDSQNWVGGSSIRTAHFIPPHKEEILQLLSDWEKFWHTENLHIPVLIKVALLHYQFETIHPFLDGNGRCGRMLIVLQLIEKGFLERPVLYISDYFEEYRQAYYDSLDKVRQRNDWENWARFFLEGVIKSASKGKKKFEEILFLTQKYEKRTESMGKKIPKVKRLLIHLYENPSVTVRQVSKILGTAYTTASTLVQDLTDLKILQEKTGFSRNRYFELFEYVNIFKK